MFLENTILDRVFENIRFYTDVNTLKKCKLFFRVYTIKIGCETGLTYKQWDTDVIVSKQ